MAHNTSAPPNPGTSRHAHLTPATPSTAIGIATAPRSADSSRKRLESKRSRTAESSREPSKIVTTTIVTAMPYCLPNGLSPRSPPRGRVLPRRTVRKTQPNSRTRTTAPRSRYLDESLVLGRSSLTLARKLGLPPLECEVLDAIGETTLAIGNPDSYSSRTGTSSCTSVEDVRSHRGPVASRISNSPSGRTAASGFTRSEPNKSGGRPRPPTDRRSVALPGRPQRQPHGLSLRPRGVFVAVLLPVRLQCFPPNLADPLVLSEDGVGMADAVEGACDRGCSAWDPRDPLGCASQRTVELVVEDEEGGHRGACTRSVDHAGTSPEPRFPPCPYRLARVV